MTANSTSGTLRIKTYFASSIEAAIESARYELGPEAMLLNSRPAPPEGRHLGQYEVVFAAVPAESEAGSLGTSPAAYSRSDYSVETLQQFGIEPRLARTTVDAQSPSIPEYLAGLISADPTVAAGPEDRQIAALIGPAGKGKTTTLIKLAITCGLARHIPVRIYAADYLMAGASAQLRLLAGILGVGFESFQTPAALDHSLRCQLPGLTLIDTPGFGPRDHDAAQMLARCLTAQPGLTSHLVLRADASQIAMSAAVERFRAFEPARLLFTGLDEIIHAGVALSTAVSAKLPLSFFSNGQSIPEDLEPASAARLVELALGAYSTAALAVA